MGFIILLIIFALLIGALSINKLVQEKCEQEQKRQKKYEQERAEQKKKQEGRQKQLDLIEHYANSEVLKEALNYICQGDYQKYFPEKITVCDQYIQSDAKGMVSTFVFAHHGIPNLGRVYIVYTLPDDKEEYTVRPQVAMAEAINRLMNGKYSIFDHRQVNSFGEGTFSYESSSVELTLQPTKFF